ncbi:hypothetical protein AB0M96_32070, partial [Streptomyces sp. NPDC051098]
FVAFALLMPFVVPGEQVSVLGLSVIAVIGGGVAGAGDVLFTPLRRALHDYATLSFVQRLRVVPALTGTDAGLVGAAAAASLGRHGEAAAVVSSRS